jgi:TonB family protein
MSFAATATMAMFGKDSRPFKTGIIVSCLFHLCILVGIPVFLQIVRGSVSFERPPTFQLVSVPQSLRPVKPLVKVKKEAVTPVPAEENAKPEENLDELASVLDEIPAPARVATAGDFKYNWYLENIQQKISRYWNPPSENSSLSVVVSFTIHSDGSVSEPAVSKHSGNGSLDDLALRAVRLAAPFGKLPPGFSGDKLELSCTLIPMRN